MLQKPTSCSGCPLYEGPYGKDWGYVPQHGSGDNGVLIVLEAAGEDEENLGIPVVGKAGQYLFSQLKRIGIDREGFRIHNVLSCRPPDNKLIKMPYTEDAIRCCTPNLDDTINAHKDHCRSIGRTPVIVGLGKFSARRLFGISEKDSQSSRLMREDYGTYPHWSERYQCWMLFAPHPSHLMQGKHSMAPVLQFVFQRAIEIAEKGLDIESPPYLLDPDPETFDSWVDRYLEEVSNNKWDTFLSYDIETPYKSGKSEAEIAKEDDDDYTILRCSFAWRPGDAVSVPWTARYFPTLERLFKAEGYFIGWNNTVYDDARILKYFNMHGTRLDGMLAWHVLNSSLEKGLGFVTPFYWHNAAMWKHLSDEMPAFYNAKDADAALRCFLGIRKDLISNNLWMVFERHVVQLNEVLSYMSRNGVLLDMQARSEAEIKLAAIQDSLKEEMDRAVPLGARRLKVFKKTPKSIEGMVQVEGERKTKRCTFCGNLDVTASHFKSIGKKRLSRGDSENPCTGGGNEKVSVPSLLWAKPLEFKLSKVGLEGYQKVAGHKAIKKRKEAGTTFDENAIKRLMKMYPEDPLYPVILRFREAQTLLTRYVGKTIEGPNGLYVKGGMPIGRDGKIHTLFTHNPSTLRLASQQPNMQNLPRPSKDPAALGNLIRNLIVPEPGTTLLARDFSGIEAVLVGYEAKAPGYLRLARRDVHSFYTAYALHELDGRISANDLPLLSWDDDKLFRRLAEIKKEFGQDRNSLYKHLVHAVNFGQGAKGAQEKIYEETGNLFNIKLIARVMDLYRELFPEIPRWQRDVRLQADDQGHLVNAFGYVHRFNHVFRYENIGGGKWEKKAGDDAEAVLAFKPQSNAAGIMKEALLRLYFNRFEEAGQYLRLTVHDEIFTQVPHERIEDVDRVLLEEMERPIPELPLPASYNMGSHLVVLTEAKMGDRWGGMH